MKKEVRIRHDYAIDGRLNSPAFPSIVSDLLRHKYG